MNFSEFLAVSLFTHVDKDLSDTISVKEMKSMFVELFGEDVTDQQINEKIREADTNGDGQVNFHEFCNVIKIYVILLHP